MNDKNWGTFENERQNLKINFNKKNVENEDFYDNNNFYHTVKYGDNNINNFSNNNINEMTQRSMQSQKVTTILLSDEAFNRKMKEYQTESFSRKKQMELSEYSEKKMIKMKVKN